MPEAINNKTVEQKMDKSVESLVAELRKVHTGRAHPSLLDHIKVSHYGNEVPLNQVCSMTVEEARVLVLSVWEKDMITVIEKGISESDLHLNPVVKGTVIRIPLPPLSEERRQELIKVIKNYGESAKVAVRNIRRDIIKKLKEAIKSSQMSEDEEKMAEASVEKISASRVKKIEELIAQKEKELLTI